MNQEEEYNKYEYYVSLEELKETEKEKATKEKESKLIYCGAICIRIMLITTLIILAINGKTISLLTFTLFIMLVHFIMNRNPHNNIIRNKND